jgi:predicted CxxxxCH...CXXCH cytochrome family protein
MARLAYLALAALGAIAGLGACSDERVTTAAAAPVFDADIAPILQAHCVSCHGGAAPAAGWSATSFLATIACVEPSGTPATVTSTPQGTPGTPPILSALGTAPHVGLLSAAEQSLLTKWVSAGAPAFVGTVHPPGIIDPRSPAFHGAVLRSQKWTQMLDATDPEACGRCHAGTPAPVPGVTTSAPGAPDCTSCHAQPGGALACSTCHGSGTRAYPPRDPCFFPGDGDGGAHAAHVEPSLASASGLPCSTCHPAPDAGAGIAIIGGTHGDGVLEVVFDPHRVVGEASFDATSGGCAVGCHDLGGTSPRPAWSETIAIDCNSCHLSPPAGHFSGACTECHAEANATGTALSGGPLHMNGRVDLGNGNGTCGACHGTGSSPWPSDGAHPDHEQPTIAEPVACASCHPVPTTLLSPGHLDGIVEVAFTGLALSRGASPAWNGTSCSQVACHGAVLADTPAAPVWNDDSGAGLACTSCHGFPPSEHTASTSCSRSDCHGTEVNLDSTGAASISASGRALHIDGIVEP